MRRLTRPLLILLAIVFLIEAWLWRHLEPIVEWIVAQIPLRAVKAWVAGDHSQAAAGGHAGRVRRACRDAVSVQAARAVAAGAQALDRREHRPGLAKLVGVAVTAFVFEVTKPKLLKMAWFRWLYEHVLAWLDWAHDLVAPIRRRIKRLLRIFRRNRPGARCGCCGASAAACGRGGEASCPGQSRCTACGANSPIAMKARPITPRPPARKLSTTIPVMTVADASTMPIWKAADANS